MMNLEKFCLELPKIELHAHLSGSLSRFTMMQLQQHLADSYVTDQFNAFLDEFHMRPGISKNLPDVFPLFAIAHNLTSTKETLAMATALTLREFEEDGCCYIELRSTPRETALMTRIEYIETIVKTIRNINSLMVTCLIISINRGSPQYETDIITDLAIEYHKKYPDIIVGMELSGNPAIGVFQDFLPPLKRAREAGLKITLHCGEICNPQEVKEMLNFKPERIGHGVCIHPDYGGTDEIWKMLCESRIPVEVCITSNVCTKSVSDYSEHHFTELYNANIPIILCTDDKGIFQTSLPNEYRICGNTFGLNKVQLAKLSLGACDHIFAEEKRKILSDMILNYINKNLCDKYSYQ